MEGIIYKEELHNLCPLEFVISVSKSKRMKRTKYVARISVLAVNIEELDC
jgi:hypothetical protein